MLEKACISDATRHRLETAGKFPARIQLTDHIVVWDEDEIDAWIASRSTVTSENAKQVCPGVRKGLKPSVKAD
jgi:predicted DNA-binding transcriptional regulator AlpA